jgi:DNA repair protein RadC
MFFHLNNNLFIPFYPNFPVRIKDISKEGRPRERFLKYGAEALSDGELFAILLRTGRRL